jgi:hypothetical protein
MGKQILLVIRHQAQSIYHSVGLHENVCRDQSLVAPSNRCRCVGHIDTDVGFELGRKPRHMCSESLSWIGGKI